MIKMNPSDGFAIQDTSWSEQDHYRLQTELWRLMAVQTRRYTSGDSSSIPVEVAEEIKQGIYFCVGAYFRSSGSGTPAENAKALQTEPLADLFQKGQNEVRRLVENGKALLNRAQTTAIPINNRSYIDTLRTLPDFFRQYDIAVMAHDIPVMIDYQLCIAVPEEFRGIDYINEYLRRLIIENAFCGCFAPESIENLLQADCADMREDLINLFDPVFRNALGLHLLGKPVFSLNIENIDRMELSELFNSLDKSQIRQLCVDAFLSMCTQLSFQEKDSAQYLHTVTTALSSRIVAFSKTGLDQIFLSCKH
jgi:hypothetical protein